MKVSINKKFASFLLSLTVFSASNLHAEMQSLSDNDLSQVDGQGIGLVMDDFIFSHGHDGGDNVFRITGVTDSQGNPVVINVNQMYIAREGSNYGSDLKGVNLGRLTNPYEIDLLDGNDIGLDGQTVLQIAAPEKVDSTVGFSCIDPTLGAGSGVCSSRPAGTLVGTEVWENGERPDMGLELEINEGGQTSNLNFNVESAVFDGSYLRLWGDESNKKMAAEFRLNFYSPQLEISTCSQNNQGCSSSIKMKQFSMELALGNTFQPLYIGVDSSTNTTTSGGLMLEIEKITHQYIDKIDLVTGRPVQIGAGDDPEGKAAFDFFNDYYVNDKYRSNIVIGQLTIGDTSPGGGGYDFGEQKIEGILIQHMDVRFRDLDRN